MAHAVSPNFLAQAQGWAIDPEATITIKDRRVRWSTLHDHPGYTWNNRTAQFCNGSITLRICVSGTVLYYTKVTDPTVDAGWETWTSLCTDATTNDIAISWSAPFTWRVIYLTAAGDVVTRTSIDNGATWSAPTIIVNAPGAYVALTGSWLVVQTTVLRVYRYSAGAWGLAGTHGTAVVSPTGVAAAYDGSTLWTIYAAAGVMLRVDIDITTPTAITFGSLYPVWPSTDAAVSTSAGLAAPCMTWAPEIGLVATWYETYAAPLSFSNAVSAIAPNAGPHFGSITPLGPSTLTTERWPISYNGLTGYIHTGGRRRILVANVYDGTKTVQVQGPLSVLSYHLERAAHEPARLTIDVLDPDYTYRDPGAEGTDTQAIAPLSAVTISRGYRLLGLTETVDSEDFYITRATFSEAHSAGHLHIEATDAFGLLELYHTPDVTYHLNHSIGWAMAILCAQVGLDLEADASAAAGVATFLPIFYLYPSESGLSAFRRLLILSQTCARPLADGGGLKLYGYPAGTEANPVNYALEARAATFGISMPGPTHTRVSSETNMVYAQEDDVRAQRLGMRLSRSHVNNTINTTALAAAVAAHYDLLAQVDQRHETITVPMRPDIEIHDTVEVYGIAGSATGQDRLVTAIVEHHEPRANKHDTTLTLGALPS